MAICRDSESAERFSKTCGCNDDDFKRVYDNADKYGFKRCVDLWNKYHRAVITRKTKGQYDYWATVNQLDMIDATGIHSQMYSVTNPDAVPVITQSIREYSRKVGFYSALPCFHRGVLKLTNGIRAIWSVDKIDELEKYFTLDVLVFYDGVEMDIGENVICANFKISIRYNPTNDPTELPFALGMPPVPKDALINMLQMVTPKQMNWTKDERLIWSQVYLKFARIINDKIPGGSLYNTIKSASTDLINIFVAINAILDKNKAKVVRSYERDDIIHINAFDQAAQDKRRERTADVVKFRSTAVPHAPSETNIRKYKVASWNVRGHPRTCASGKITWVREHPNHRKCMTEEQKKLKPAPSTITLNMNVVDIL
ncbi:MAG: hypothetical protein NC489_08330 [Ruminococcus flavefaciens]|nr:hypothetical protein [Ruminococcus flavefaciens]